VIGLNAFLSKCRFNGLRSAFPGAISAVRPTQTKCRAAAIARGNGLLHILSARFDPRGASPTLFHVGQRPSTPLRAAEHRSKARLNLIKPKSIASYSIKAWSDLIRFFRFCSRSLILEHSFQGDQKINGNRPFYPV